jgi:hypothetical protein
MFFEAMTALPYVPAMTILASNLASSSHLTAFESCSCMIISRRRADDVLRCVHLGVAPLVRDVSGMDEDVSLRELNSGVVRVGDADDSRPPKIWLRHEEEMKRFGQMIMMIFWCRWGCLEIMLQT